MRAKFDNENNEVKLSFRLSEKLAARIRMVASVYNMSVGEVCRLGLKRLLEQAAKQNKGKS